MSDQNKYSKLTPAAKEELEKSINIYKEDLVNKAFELANKRSTADKEIALRDLLEAQEAKNQILEKERLKSIKRIEFLQIISICASVYAIGGILIYFFMNKKDSIETESGLIIAFVGILLTLTILLYTQLMSKKTLQGVVFRSEKHFQNKDSYEIVKRWQMIESLARNLISVSEIESEEQSSLSFIINFLSHKVAKDEKEFLKIKELLQLRNKIIHEDYRIPRSKKEDFIEFADKIIERLEAINSQKVENSGILKIIKATYGTKNQSFDATFVLNKLINNNRLEVIANNDIVGDPDPGYFKELNITFELEGKLFTSTFQEGQKVILEKTK